MDKLGFNSKEINNVQTLNNSKEIKSITIEDHLHNVYHPETNTDMVIDKDGNKLTEILANYTLTTDLDNKINNITQYLGANANLLWSGATCLRDTETIYPTKPLLECMNGWLLMWSDGDKNTSDGLYGQYVFQYIHKRVRGLGNSMLQLIPVAGDTVNDDLSHKTETIVTKTLYLKENGTGISGHVSNIGSEEKWTPHGDVVLGRIFEW